MATIQIALGDAGYRKALEDHLRASTSCRVRCVDHPDVSVPEVVVLDPENLDSLPLPINNPDRIVLIAAHTTRDMSRAWDAGVSSVAMREDPLSTVAMAVLSACLRVGEPLTSGPP